MALMNQERKAKIVSAAKPVLAKYGMKATFRCDSSAITCTLKSGSIDFISEMAPQPTSAAWPGRVMETEALRSRYNFDVNSYWFHEHYTDGTAKNFIGEMMSALEAADYYDRSDSSTDYFDTAYYYNLNVGNWNKPYDLTR